VRRVTADERLAFIRSLEMLSRFLRLVQSEGGRALTRTWAPNKAAERFTVTLTGRAPR